MLTLFLALALLSCAALLIRPSLGGKPFAFAALFVLPVGAVLMGTEAHIEHSKETQFCASCHVMQRHHRSLLVDDVSLLAAAHFQGGRIPRDRACFSCHTTYTMYGDFAAKLRGAKHVWVNYFGKAPDKLHLYEPYHNRECLHCHQGTRRYLAGETHTAEAGRMEKMGKNELSCMAAKCHDTVHAADEVDKLPLWQPGGKS